MMAMENERYRVDSWARPSSQSLTTSFLFLMDAMHSSFMMVSNGVKTIQSRIIHWRRNLPRRRISEHVRMDWLELALEDCNVMTHRTQ